MRTPPEPGDIARRLEQPQIDIYVFVLEPADRWTDLQPVTVIAHIERNGAVETVGLIARIEQMNAAPALSAARPGDRLRVRGHRVNQFRGTAIGGSFALIEACEINAINEPALGRPAS